MGDLTKILEKCFLLSVMLYSAETQTIKKGNKRRIEALEMWVWRRLDNVCWKNKVSNEVLKKIKDERNILNTIVNMKRNHLGHCMRRGCLLVDAVEELVNGKRRTRKKKMMDGIMKMKRLAQDRNK